MQQEADNGVRHRRLSANSLMGGLRRRPAMVAAGAAVLLAATLVAATRFGGDPTPVSAGAARPAPQGQASPADSGTADPSEKPAPEGKGSGDDRKRDRCAPSALLVPACGVWWGVAPGAFTKQPRELALRDFERKIGRPVDIYHAYHSGDQVFPTDKEIAIARERGRPRKLLLNWKPGGRSWASVAKGEPAVDRHIDRLSAHIKRNFPERFWLVIHHEPENEVRPQSGSGFTARDFAGMFRHVVQRFRSNGVRNVLFTPVFMGSQVWGKEPWFEQLYPGNDVVDWVGYDPYAPPPTRDFAHLVNKKTNQGRGFPGFYDWTRRVAPGKPLMLAEWGVFEQKNDPGRKQRFYASVAEQIGRFPRLKALVYFDSPRAPRGDTRIDSTGGALDAYRALGARPTFAATR
jgi:hypothetical protein